MYWDELNRQHAGMRVEVNDPFFKAKAQGIVSCPAENAPVLLLVGRKYHTFWVVCRHFFLDDFTDGVINGV